MVFKWIKNMNGFYYLPIEVNKSGIEGIMLFRGKRGIFNSQG